MVIKKDTEPHQVEETICYRVAQIIYVPHYRNPHVFVGPGYPKLNITRFSEDELKSCGAVPIKRMLWPRKLTDVVTDSNP
jgi:hypothetical protein